MWEHIELTVGNKNHRHGKGWSEYPAVSVTKGGLSFNAKFQEAFSCSEGTRVLLHFDIQVGRRLGLKVCANLDSTEGAGRLRYAHKKGTSGRDSIYLACKEFVQRIPDCVGLAYRAHLNAGERVIEVSLDPDNRCK